MLLLGIGMTIAGCQRDGGAMSYRKGEDPSVGEAGRTGYYALHMAGSRGDPMYKYYVQRGEPLGFRRTSDRRLEAVAGQYHFTLRGENDYEWKYAGSEGRK